jgi:hypothetical protein
MSNNNDIIAALPEILYVDGNHNVAGISLPSANIGMANIESVFVATILAYDTADLSSSDTKLGDITSVHIEGGSPGQILSTDVDGNLSWSTTGGGGGNGVILISY